MLTQASPGPRELKIIYSPLHGVGATAVCRCWRRTASRTSKLFGPHAKPDGDFPNVPGHVSNPENPTVFDAIIARAKEAGADLALATDPDCDRIGCAAPLTFAKDAPWHTLTGNQIVRTAGRLRARESQGGRADSRRSISSSRRWSPRSWSAASATATACGRSAICWSASNGSPARSTNIGPELFIFGTEESHGYLAGTLRPRQGRRRGLDAAVRAGRQAEGGRPDAARKARRPVLATWRACRADGLGADAGQRGHGPDAGSDGRVPQPARRPKSAATASCRSAITSGKRSHDGGKAAAARRAEGRSGVPRSRATRQLRRLPAQRHGAEDQVLHVRLHAAGAAANLETGQRQNSKSGSTRWKPTCGSLPGSISSPPAVAATLQAPHFTSAAACSPSNSRIERSHCASRFLRTISIFFSLRRNNRPVRWPACGTQTVILGVRTV